MALKLSPAVRAIILSGFIAAVVGVVGLTGWLLWPTWREFNIRRAAESGSAPAAWWPASWRGEFKVRRWLLEPCKWVADGRRLRDLCEDLKTGSDLNVVLELPDPHDGGLSEDTRVFGWEYDYVYNYGRVSSGTALRMIHAPDKSAQLDLRLFDDQKTAYLNFVVRGDTLILTSSPLVWPRGAGGENRADYWARSLRDLDPLVRREAVCGLLQIGRDAKPALPALIAALKDPDCDVRWVALLSLERLGDDAAPALPAVIATVLKDDHPSVRLVAAYHVLPRTGPGVTHVISAMLELMEHEHTLACTATAEAEHKVNWPDRPIDPRDIQDRLVDEHDALRRAAVVVLSDIGAEAVPALVDALSHWDPFVRAAAADALGKIGPQAKAAVPALAGGVGNSYRAVRWEATIALRKIGPDAREALPSLLAATKDSDPSVRLEAVVALGAVAPNADPTVPTIIQSLKDSDARIREQAARTLSDIGPEARRAIAALIESLKDEKWGVRKRACVALTGMGELAVPQLIDALEHDHSEVRGWAAEALGRIGAAARVAVPALVARLRNTAEIDFVRKDAALALGRLGPSEVDAITALEQARRDETALVRDAAETALKRIEASAAAERYQP